MKNISTDIKLSTINKIVSTNREPSDGLPVNLYKKLLRDAGARGIVIKKHLRGDLRGFWEVSGRIDNQTSFKHYI